MTRTARVELENERIRGARAEREFIMRKIRLILLQNDLRGYLIGLLDELKDRDVGRAKRV